MKKSILILTILCLALIVSAKKKQSVVPVDSVSSVQNTVTPQQEFPILVLWADYWLQYVEICAKDSVPVYETNSFTTDSLGRVVMPKITGYKKNPRPTDMTEFAKLLMNAEKQRLSQPKK